MNNSKNNNNKIASLDGLRAIAIILVLCRHTVKPFVELFPTHFDIGPYNVLTFFLNGWVGVDLFFVLSGFLIAKTFPVERFNARAIKAYLLKRILRIVPAYYTVLGICCAVLWVSAEPPSNGLFYSALYHAVFLQDYTGANINVVFWSLGVEEKFYILCIIFVPLIFFIHKKRSFKGTILCIFMIILMGMIMRYAGYVRAGMPNNYAEFFLSVRAPFHACLEPLFLGVLIAVFYSSKSYYLDKRRILSAKFIFYLSAVSLAFIMFSSRMMLNISAYDVTIQPLLIAFSMAGLVYGAVFSGGVGYLENKSMAYISKISYSLYLIHVPLFPLAFYTAQYIAAGSHIYVFFLLTTLIYIPISLGCAHILYKIVEEPFLKIKNNL